VDGCQEMRKRVRSIRHLCNVREIDPGEEVQKIEWPIGCGFRQYHRHDLEGRIAALADNRKLAFVLLSIAEPTRSDQHDCRFGCANCLFQRADPG
jgi:hypothetical protein